MDSFHLAAFFTDAAAQPDDMNARLFVNIATFLAVLCWVFIGLFVLSCFTSSLRKRFNDAVHDKVPFLLWLIPSVAMFLSLYFSEVLGWTPCKLCWYQRACMYPLAILMLIYWFKRAAIVRRLAFVFAGVGPLISIYHIGVERLWFSESTTCDPDIPCSQVWFYSMGFLTIAGMALSAFVAVLVLLYLETKNSQKTPSS